MKGKKKENRPARDLADWLERRNKVILFPAPDPDPCPELHRGYIDESKAHPDQSDLSPETVERRIKMAIRGLVHPLVFYNSDNPPPSVLEDWKKDEEVKRKMGFNVSRPPVPSHASGDNP